MRCLMAVKMTPAEEAANKMPTQEGLDRMDVFNNAMRDAGILVDAQGLKPTSKAARVTFDDAGKPSVIDGPFTEAKELIAGFWIIDVKSLDEALDWARRCPQGEGFPRRIEVRPYFEPEDFAYLAEQK